MNAQTPVRAAASIIDTPELRGIAFDNTAEGRAATVGFLNALAGGLTDEERLERTITSAKAQLRSAEELIKLGRDAGVDTRGLEIVADRQRTLLASAEARANARYRG